MSYGNLHIKPGASDPGRPTNKVYDAVYIPVTWLETENRKKKLVEKYSADDCYIDFVRDKRANGQDQDKPDFVHRLSYNKAIGYISKRELQHKYNGSSYNRKPSKPLTDQQRLENEYIDFKKTPFPVTALGYGLNKHDIKAERLRDQRQRRAELAGKHLMSKRTKEKIRDKMLAFYRSCSGRKGFRTGVVDFTLLTLTFIAPVDDQAGMELLNNFFTTLKYKYGKFHYISVTERQKNGNIHFHILADIRLPIAFVNSLWVKQQFDKGIVNKEAEYQLKNDYGTTFQNLHETKQYTLIQNYLNPVDIDKVKTIDGISMYLTKYVTKNDGIFDCSVWSCSNAISKLFTCQLITAGQFRKTGDRKKNRVLRKAGQYKNPDTGLMEYKPERIYINETYYGDYCQINTIYNKSHYRHYVSEMESINKYILKKSAIGGLPLTREIVIKLIELDKDTFRAQYCDFMKEKFTGSKFSKFEGQEGKDLYFTAKN